jgi:hypothetical protein
MYTINTYTDTQGVILIVTCYNFNKYARAGVNVP